MAQCLVREPEGYQHGIDNLHQVLSPVLRWFPEAVNIGKDIIILDFSIAGWIIFSFPHSTE